MIHELYIIIVFLDTPISISERLMDEVILYSISLHVIFSSSIVYIMTTFIKCISGKNSEQTFKNSKSNFFCCQMGVKSGLQDSHKL